MKNATSRFKATVTSPLGTLLLAASTQGLAGVWFSNQRHRPSEGLIHSWPTDASNPVLQATAQQLSRYWEGGLNRFDLPLDLSDGTLFQQSVWSALCAIPPGQTLRYGELASQIGRPAAVRAVGSALGKNPFAPVVPCHRVIKSDGTLGGFSAPGGLKAKLALLKKEKAKL